MTEEEAHTQSTVPSLVEELPMVLKVISTLTA